MKNISQVQKFIIVISLLFFLVSCNSYKKLTYLQKVPITNDDSVLTNIPHEYKLQSSDVLYVKVISKNETLNTMFNPTTANASAAATNESSIYFQSYIIDDSGYVDLPILSKIKLHDKTLSEAQQIIKDSVLRYFNDIQVMVKLAVIKFTLLGEVKSPGIKTSYDTRISIMEALAYGGDITYNGNRQKILIIRPTVNGSKTYIIDVTKKELIESEGFYILPNDVVYVPPLRATLFRERSKDYIFIIPTITSMITTIILIVKAF